MHAGCDWTGVALDKFASSEIIALVVDDDDTTRELVIRLLTAMGAAEVIAASDGGEGLRLVFERHPHLVICDVSMQPVDGLALLGGVRASVDYSIANTPIILFTATQESLLLRKARGLGVSGYMVKPFNPKGFASYVCEVLEKKAFPAQGKAGQ